MVFCGLRSLKLHRATEQGLQQAREKQELREKDAVCTSIIGSEWELALMKTANAQSTRRTLLSDEPLKEQVKETHEPELENEGL